MEELNALTDGPQKDVLDSHEEVRSEISPNNCETVASSSNSNQLIWGTTSLRGQRLERGRSVAENQRAVLFSCLTRPGISFPRKKTTLFGRRYCPLEEEDEMEDIDLSNLKNIGDSFGQHVEFENLKRLE